MLSIIHHFDEMLDEASARLARQAFLQNCNAFVQPVARTNRLDKFDVPVETTQEGPRSIRLIYNLMDSRYIRLIV